MRNKDVDIRNNYILWIDDDLDLLRPQRLNLIDLGYNVLIESNIDHAMAKIDTDREQIRGLIIDLMMNPGALLRSRGHQGGLRTGLFFVEYLSKERRIDNLRMFVFTHRFDPEAAEKLRLQFGIGYFQKQDYKGAAIVELVQSEFGPPNQDV